MFKKFKKYNATQNINVEVYSMHKFANFEMCFNNIQTIFVTVPPLCCVISSLEL